MATPFWCRLWHRWTPWQGPYDVSGLNVAWELVHGVEYRRSCQRCGRVDIHARAS